MKRINNNTRKLDKLFKLYAFLLQGKAGAYYWHYSHDYDILKKADLS